MEPPIQPKRSTTKTMRPVSLVYSPKVSGLVSQSFADRGQVIQRPADDAERIACLFAKALRLPQHHCIVTSNG